MQKVIFHVLLVILKTTFVEPKLPGQYNWDGTSLSPQQRNRLWWGWHNRARLHFTFPTMIYHRRQTTKPGTTWTTLYDSSQFRKPESGLHECERVSSSFKELGCRVREEVKGENIVSNKLRRDKFPMFHCMKTLKLTFLKLTLCQSPWRRVNVWRLTKYEPLSYHDVIIINLPKSSSLIQKQHNSLNHFTFGASPAHAFITPITFVL